MTHATQYELHEVYEELLQVYDMDTADRIIRKAQSIQRKGLTFRDKVTRAIEAVCLPEMY